MQKISNNETCTQKNRTASEGIVGGQTFMWMVESNVTDFNELGYGLLEFILSPSNLNAAYLQVRRNKGAAGVDKLEVESLKDYLIKNKTELTAAIFRGIYRPHPVRRVEIPKDNGQKRQLGIPTVVDRVIQQAIAQVLSGLYEPQFSDHSYGFRPKRNAHQALEKCRKYITEGYEYAVDLDLEKFFDKVNHSKLIEVLSRTIKDGRVVSFIHKYLNAGVQIGGQLEASEIGVPQGGPLSPLLSNVMLNELDKELERRGHKFVRYADDLVIMCKSKRGAERVMGSIILFIEEKLFLKVNKEKSQVARHNKVKFLGYSFYKPKDEGRLGIHPKSVSKMKARIKVLTSRSNGWGNERRKEALRQYIVGWVNYFKLADMKNLLKQVDGWYRRRLRMVIWKQWKRIKTKLTNLIKLGVKKSKAWEWANSRKGYWPLANSFILATSITTERLRQAGFTFFSDQYQKVRIKT
jgi:group II intron reverse transcriptase/maturase